MTAKKDPKDLDKVGRKWFDGKSEKAVLSKLRKCAKLDCGVIESCNSAKISTAAYYRYLEAYPEFREELELLRDDAITIARKSVIKHMKKDGALALKYLERKRKDEFSTKQIVNAEVETREMPPEKKKRVTDILKENGDL